jgi:hypothetical protein
MSWRCTQLLGLTMWLGTGYAAPSDPRVTSIVIASQAAAYGGVAIGLHRTLGNA